MVELISGFASNGAGLEATGLFGSGFGLLSSLLGLIALGIYALTQSDPGNDDDDSTPGGGLMQPVS